MSLKDVFVVITLAGPAASRLLSNETSCQAAGELAEVIGAHNARTIPYSLVQDESGSRFVTIGCPSRKDAELLLASVLKLDGVQAAYIKPMEELP
ncbi:MAG: hypothetical protein SFV81_26495 [Pirellulaceae bacterium]|nr:hypothetical protein [Pirellulaceae bacterium]